MQSKKTKGKSKKEKQRALLKVWLIYSGNLLTLTSTNAHIASSRSFLFKYSLLCSQIYIRGSLHESGLSYNPDRTRCVSVETIGDWTIFVYMNFRINLIPFFDMSIQNHACKLGSRFLYWMKSTITMAEIKTVCKMGSSVNVLKCISV